MNFFPTEMGRKRVYATPEEAQEAKKNQMKQAYQRRKAAKNNSPKSPKKIDVKEEPEPPLVEKIAPNTIQETVVDLGNLNSPKPRKLKISEKASIYDQIQALVTRI